MDLFEVNAMKFGNQNIPPPYFSFHYAMFFSLQ